MNGLELKNIYFNDDAYVKDSLLKLYDSRIKRAV